MSVQYHRCEHETYGAGRCHEQATRAMRSPGFLTRSTVASWLCETHSEQMAALGHADVTEIESGVGLLARIGDHERLLATLGYGS